ncbi:hypothetical protein CAPN007_10430 [Capnocytophaga canimorsus]|nr:hypothetical protein CAPN007_10430 [Capnocytophaga canimorsus]
MKTQTRKYNNHKLEKLTEKLQGAHRIKMLKSIIFKELDQPNHQKYQRYNNLKNKKCGRIVNIIDIIRL